MGRGPCFVLEEEFQPVCKERGGVKCCAKSTSKTLLYVTQELSRRAAQGSLDPHQIREEQQPWRSGKLSNPRNSSWEAAHHPPQTGMSGEWSSFPQPPSRWREASPEGLST